MVVVLWHDVGGGVVVVLWHDVGGGVVVVLWHDVGRLCRFRFGRCYRELCGGGLRARWRAAREVPSVVTAVFVVHSFCALCLLYLPFVGVAL